MVIVVRQRDDDESPSSGSRCDVGRPSLASAAFRRAPWEADITRGWVRLGRHVTVCKIYPTAVQGRRQWPRTANETAGDPCGRRAGGGTGRPYYRTRLRRWSQPASQKSWISTPRGSPNQPGSGIRSTRTDQPLRAQHRVTELIFLSYTLVPLDSPCPPPASPLPRCVR